MIVDDRPGIVTMITPTQPTASLCLQLRAVDTPTSREHRITRGHVTQLPRSVLGPQPNGEPWTTADKSGHRTFGKPAARSAYSPRPHRGATDEEEFESPLLRRLS
jgi:hypothetical protein